MKIYTRSGDEGETGLFAGGRVRKDHARIEAYGAVDELNAFLGLARTTPLSDLLDAILVRTQNELFHLGAQLASGKAASLPVRPLADEDVQRIEEDIDRLELRLPPLRAFILPGGTSAAAHLHAARTICRRAERRLVRLEASEASSVPGLLLRYLNRLGDLLFVLARAANAEAGTADQLWQKKEPGL